MQNFLIIPSEWNRYKQQPGRPCSVWGGEEIIKKRERERERKGGGKKRWKSWCLICENNALTNEFSQVCFLAYSSLFGFVLIEHADLEKWGTARGGLEGGGEVKKKKEVFVQKTPYLDFLRRSDRALPKWNGPKCKTRNSLHAERVAWGILMI